MGDDVQTDASHMLVAAMSGLEAAFNSPASSPQTRRAVAKKTTAEINVLLDALVEEGRVAWETTLSLRADTYLLTAADSSAHGANWLLAFDRFCSHAQAHFRGISPP